MHHSLCAKKDSEAGVKSFSITSEETEAQREGRELSQSPTPIRVGQNPLLGALAPECSHLQVCAELFSLRHYFYLPDFQQLSSNKIFLTSSLNLHSNSEHASSGFSSWGNRLSWAVLCPSHLWPRNQWQTPMISSPKGQPSHGRWRPPLGSWSPYNGMSNKCSWAVIDCPPPTTTTYSFLMPIAVWFRSTISSVKQYPLNVTGCSYHPVEG